jgi:hypothetical protein
MHQCVQKLNEFKLYLISYPEIPNSSCLGNFFILKIMIENRNFSKIAPFGKIVMTYLLRVKNFRLVITCNK